MNKGVKELTKIYEYLELLPVIGVFLKSEYIIIRIIGILAVIAIIIGISVIIKKVARLFK